jgi:SAM-dependent methyltransferase
MLNIFVFIVVTALFIVYIFVFVIPLFHGAPYVPTKFINIERLDKLLNISAGTLIADLGSGDGRILIHFAQKGFKCDGFELNKYLYSQSKNKIKALGLEDKINVFRENFLKADLSKYGFVFLFQAIYILPKIETQLIKQLKPGSIVASYCYKFKHLKPIKEADGWFVYQM